ncbi:MAG: V/A-type H+/Na+-transporting ATPase subunit A [Candidatus Argoarchaeum ethanivorans]|uniref:A-type ATP synthase subunit A n=1 Tax=Candidatus Argoarchaeum ethanivorans TaxID=2608793 RepID=A0A8B6SDE0_9EURY|nr:MAG: V/A-type H+/Na+-transporting ATPase subunit A [Candidatus Argoarchaeum ethanivorans]
MEIKGEIYRISGPVVTALNINARMYDVVKVGDEGLMGEVIGIKGEKTIIQVYEDTSGVKPGEPVIDTGMPLSVELGPGLLESIYDGIQRPLPVLKEKMGDFIQRGVSASGLDHNKQWEFKPVVKKGDKLKGGEIIGTVQETGNILHRILLPPNVSGVVDEINEGTFTVDDVIGRLSDGTELKLMHYWPVRHPRPVKNKLRPTIPLITGQRIFDGLFPLAKGGTAAIPGPFGSGKTVMQQQLAKWSDAEIVVYIGCGERGNEMADVLNEFPELEDPKTGRPLMERTVLIANTSNMPVAAREASVYTGITIAEYYRDMGYDVSLMADSTSRWAEAMREISSRLEEMPGEEGYPAYLAAKLAEFYERAGRAKTLCEDEGSVTVIGAVSPPGGDFSEPVTQNTLRIVKVFWALDAKLAQRRHFPAINWLTSYSLYGRTLDEWYNENISTEWTKLRSDTMNLLQREAELQDIVQLVGSDALPDDQQLTLEIARMVREYFLQQNAYHDVDSYCPMINQYKMLKAILTWGEKAVLALESGASVTNIVALESRDMLAKVRFEKDIDAVLDTVMKKADEEFAAQTQQR